MPTNLLLVDDDVAFCDLLCAYLNGEDFNAEAIHDGPTAITHLREAAPDIVILDVMMPVMNGLDVLRELRSFSSVPVVMLTARGDDIDRIVGLELGADDYVAKPCNPREIVARARAILRRSRGAVDSVNHSDASLVVDDVELRGGERTVLQNGQPLELTSTEYDVLDVLLRNVGKVVEKAQVSQIALNRRLGPYDRSIDMHISRLRRKLGVLPGGGERIKTVRGSGYLYVRCAVDPARQ
ncbi:MAG: response regulator transcription factor [Proteobacteria bacterium]|nr:response regulator transcription factor [Pseudomonadota bacterium]